MSVTWALDALPIQALRPDGLTLDRLQERVTRLIVERDKVSLPAIAGKPSWPSIELLVGRDSLGERRRVFPFECALS